ncbi:glycosyltransferase family 2 protein [Candidatus Woesebacteria bacterium]|nr:glycosyltransferase family 2 protein [Candidatus Woesebacteria bacterium]
MNKLRKWVHRHPIRTKRALEILPGTVSWFLILFPIWGSLVIPEIVAYYIIAFSVYWFYRSMSTALLAVLGYFKLKSYEIYDWMSDVKKLPEWKKTHHIIIIPTYKEPLETLKRTFEYLKKQTYPLKQIHIMVSFEEREGQDALDKAAALIATYGKTFGHVWATHHPDLPGEVKGKSSNTSWGAKEAKRLLIDKEGYNIDLVTITSEDADALLPPSYFAALTYHYLTSTNRHITIWQAILQFYNNIDKVPLFVRVFASSGSVMQLAIVMRRDRLINFSTYTASLKMIDGIGYWDTDVIPEDWRLFFKAFYTLQGRVSVEPIFLPIKADAAEAEGTWNTYQNQYEQVKRWAWGVSDTPYVISRWITSTDVPFWEKTIRTLRVIEDHFLWPVNWFAITIGALLPPLLNAEFSRTIIGKTLPQVTSAILTVCLLALLVMVILNYKLRPHPPGKRFPIFGYIFEAIEFVTLPVVGFFFTALPGIDAHTRLMLGKYIEYKVTEKVSPETK